MGIVCTPRFHPLDENDGEPNEEHRPYYASGWGTWRKFCAYLRQTLSFDFDGEDGGGIYINPNDCKKIVDELKIQLIHYIGEPKREGIYSPDGLVCYKYVMDIGCFCKFCNQCSHPCYDGFYID